MNYKYDLTVFAFITIFLIIMTFCSRKEFLNRKNVKRDLTIGWVVLIVSAVLYYLSLNRFYL